MRNIVLITRENGGRVTHVSVIYCNDYREAANLCGLVNRFFIAGNEKLAAMCISAGREFTLEKGTEFSYDDLAAVDDRTIQKIMREIDVNILKTALIGSSDSIKELFLRNLSKRAAEMLEEDMSYIGPVFDQEIDKAKLRILEVYDYVRRENEEIGEFQSVFDKYAEEKTKEREKKYPKTGCQRAEYIALVFRGRKEIAETVSVAVFDSSDARFNFCEFINKLKPSDGSFVFAREADQMTEYEINKPLLARFDQIARWDGFLIGTALRKIDRRTVAAALKGLNKETREEIIGNLPHRVADDVIALLDRPVIENTKQARQKIVNAIIAVEKHFKKGRIPADLEVMKD